MAPSVLITVLICIHSSIGLSSNCSVFTSEPSCIPKYYPSSQQCQHVKSCCNDIIGDGIIPYIEFVYCNLDGNNRYYLPFLIVTIIYLLIIIAIISQHFFAELMQETTKYLNVQPHVAGATFVAWGNGIATMSSSITAISYGGNGIKLGLGALFGLSVFNISFICATISLIAQKTIINHYSLLRDGFYLIVVSFYIIIVYSYGEINLILSVILLIMYIVYVFCIWITTVITNYISQKRLETTLRETAANVLEPTSTHISSNQLYNEKEQSRSLGTLLSVSKSQRIQSILQIQNRHIIFKIIIYIIGSPVFIVWQLLKLTVPLPNYTHWNDLIACLHCITVPTLFYFAFIFIDVDRNKTFLIIPLLFGCSLSLIVCVKLRFKQPKSLKTLLSQRKSDYNETTYGTIDTFQVPQVTELSSKIILLTHESKNTIDKESTDSQLTIYNKTYVFDQLSKQPVMKGLFLCLSFISLITWIKIISEELISILSVLGIISGIDFTLLGIFILSLVNSIPDLMNNVSVALKGNPKMSVAACFGGSSLEITIGFGFGALIGSLRSDNNIIQLPKSKYVMIGCFYTIAICIVYITLIFLHKWKLNKMFGIFGYLFYLSFLVTNIFISV